MGPRRFPLPPEVTSGAGAELERARVKPASFWGSLVAAAAAAVVVGVS